MHVRSKRLTGLVALGASALLLVAACSSKTGGTNKGPQYSPGYAECATKADDCNSGARKEGGQIVLAQGKTIPNFNVNADDGALVESVEIMNMVQPTPYWFYPSAKIVWNKDMLVSEPAIKSQSPQTIEYKIRPEAKWDDDTPINADDFIYAWKTLDGHDKKINAAGTTGYDQIQSVTGSDSGKTVTVVFKDPYADWKGLFTGLYPAHIAAKAGDISTDAGLEAGFKAQYAQPTWSGGPFKITSYDKPTQTTLVPNPKWYGFDKPTLTQVIFKPITDASQQIPALKNQEIQGANVQPSQTIYEQLQQMANVQFEITAGAAYEHLVLNTKSPQLADQKLREAILTAIDRQAIIDKTVKAYFPDAKPLGSHTLLSNQEGYEDTLSKVAPDQGNGKVDAAKKILSDAGYTGVGTALKDKSGKAVGFTLRSTGTAARKATAEIMQSELKQLGITVTYKVTDDLSGTLEQEDFDGIVFGFAGSPLLGGTVDIWKTGGGSNYTQWGDSQVDDYLKQMATSLDQQKRYQLLHQADEIITKAAVDLPMYLKPNLMMVTKDYVNIRDNNFGSYYTYNTQQWGVKAA